MCFPQRILIADNRRRPRGPAPPPATGIQNRYQPEHSERQASGSVNAGPGIRWHGTLAVAMDGDQSLLVTIERIGPFPADAPEPCGAAVVIPPGEADAVVELLRGLVAHARKAGVLQA